MPICEKCGYGGALFQDPGSNKVVCPKCFHVGKPVPTVSMRCPTCKQHLTTVVLDPGMPNVNGDVYEFKLEDVPKYLSGRVSGTLEVRPVGAGSCPSCGGVLRRIRMGRLCTDCGALYESDSDVAYDGPSPLEGSK